MPRPRDFGFLYPSLWVVVQFFLMWFIAVPTGKRLLKLGAAKGLPGMAAAYAWAMQ